MNELHLEDVQKAVRDTFYVSIGLGVIAFQKAQVQRQELRKSLETNVGEARTNVEDSLKTIDERLGAVEERIDAVLDDVEVRLPEQARAVMSQARTTAKDVRGQLRGLVGLG